MPRTQSAKDRSLKRVSLPRICKFKKGDRLRLMVGRKAGPSAIGELMSIDTKKGRLMIKGVNMVTKHVKRDPNQTAKEHGRVQVEASVHVSNVALICPKCMLPTRVGWRVLETKRVENNRKIRSIRICRRCHEPIDD
jgi:large subunit ribosomal protein L24